MCLHVLCVYLRDPGYTEHVITEIFTVRTADSGDDTVVIPRTKHTVFIEQLPLKYNRVFQVAPFTN